jgi:hypothetical protein
MQSSQIIFLLSQKLYSQKQIELWQAHTWHDATFPSFMEVRIVFT